MAVLIYRCCSTVWLIQGNYSIFIQTLAESLKFEIFVKTGNSFKVVDTLLGNHIICFIWFWICPWIALQKLTRIVPIIVYLFRPLPRVWSLRLLWKHVTVSKSLTLCWVTILYVLYDFEFFSGLLSKNWPQSFHYLFTKNYHWSIEFNQLLKVLFMF